MFKVVIALQKLRKKKNCMHLPMQYILLSIFVYYLWVLNTFIVCHWLHVPQFPHTPFLSAPVLILRKKNTLSWKYLAVTSKRCRQRKMSNWCYPQEDKIIHTFMVWDWAGNNRSHLGELGQGWDQEKLDRYHGLNSIYYNLASGVNNPSLPCPEMW